MPIIALNQSLNEPLTHCTSLFHEQVDVQESAAHVFTNSQIVTSHKYGKSVLHSRTPALPEDSPIPE